MVWEDRLARPLILNDGRTLETLREAADVLASDRFRHVTYSPSLDRAVALVMRASEEPADIQAATDHVAMVLRMWKMMD